MNDIVTPKIESAAAALAYMESVSHMYRLVVDEGWLEGCPGSYHAYIDMLQDRLDEDGFAGHVDVTNDGYHVPGLYEIGPHGDRRTGWPALPPYVEEDVEGLTALYEYVDHITQSVAEDMTWDTTSEQ